MERRTAIIRTVDDVIDARAVTTVFQPMTYDRDLVLDPARALLQWVVPT